MHKLWAVSFAMLASACASGAMIRTVDRTQPPPENWDASRMSYLGDYALPQSRFVVTVSAPPPSSTTLSGVYAAPTASQSWGDAADWCRDHRRTYNRNLRVLTDVKFIWAGLARRNATEISAMTAADRASWATALAEYLKAYEAAQPAADYNVVALEEIIPKCPQPIRVQISEVVERDPSRAFAVFAARDDAASDSLTLTLSSGGFVTGLSGTANDRSLEVAVGGVKAITSVLTSFAPQAPSRGVTSVSTDDCPSADPSATNSAQARNWLKNESALDQNTIACILELLQLPELPEIDVALPIEASATPAGASGTIRSPFTFPKAAEPLGLNGSVICTAGPAWPGGTAPGEGLTVSTPMPCEARILRREDQEEVVLALANTWALNAGLTSVLEVPRTPFVSHTVSYAFSDGRQTSTEWSRPSPAEQVVTAPARLIGAVVETVAAGVTGETGRIKAETAQIEAETARIEAAARLIEAQAAAAKRED